LSGVGVYSREMLNGLAALHPSQQFLHAYRPHRLWRGLRSPRAANVSGAVLLESRVPSRRHLFHGLNQRLPAARFRRSVCTFHDLFVLTGEYSTAEFRQRFALQAREAARRADLLIAVSSFTAGQLTGCLGVEQSRIRVIPHGVRFRGLAPAREREPLVLCAGALQIRKNTSRLVQAFARALPAPWRLVLAGSHGYGAAAILEEISRSPARDRIECPGWVSDVRLQDLYARATMFAFPSLDEGFGIPVLEAMAAGLPVISSNGSALAEVCADAALLVDPCSTDEIAAAMARMAGEAGLREQYARLGLARARSYTWERAVEATWNVYEELRR
jgi:glycosyltransferase involved in cell wall biosynthesis